jgi:uncharacterized protein YaiL (DUF2058 family)
MGNSLQEQLLKAGLVSAHQARQNRTEKRKQDRQPSRGEADADRLAARKAQAEKAERDRELNRRREEAARRKAVATEVAEMIRTHALPRAQGETAYHFVDGKLVKRIYVTADQHRQITAGQLAVARLGQRYELVPLAVAEKIRSRDERFLVPQTNPGTTEPEDDAYAAYRVPDDLMW